MNSVGVHPPAIIDCSKRLSHFPEVDIFGAVAVKITISGLESACSSIFFGCCIETLSPATDFGLLTSNVGFETGIEEVESAVCSDKRGAASSPNQTRTSTSDASSSSSLSSSYKK